jgi:hypothetical protein
MQNYIIFWDVFDRLINFHGRLLIFWINNFLDGIPVFAGLILILTFYHFYFF